VTSIFATIAAVFGFLRDLLGWKQRAEDRQAGRDEVKSAVNAETLETKNAMDGVARPSDDAVADSLKKGTF
jgi:hypothetical protein